MAAKKPTTEKPKAEAQQSGADMQNPADVGLGSAGDPVPALGEKMSEPGPNPAGTVAFEDLTEEQKADVLAQLAEDASGTKAPGMTGPSPLVLPMPDILHKHAVCGSCRKVDDLVYRASVTLSSGFVVYGHGLSEEIAQQNANIELQKLAGSYPG